MFSILVNEAKQTSSLVLTAYLAVFFLSCFLSVLLLLFGIIVCSGRLMIHVTERSEIVKTLMLNTTLKPQLCSHQQDE